MYNKLLLAVVLMFSAIGGFAQSGDLWTRVSPERAGAAGKVKPVFEGVQGTFFTLDAVKLKEALSNVNDKEEGSTNVIVSIPTINGKTEHFRVIENSNFEPSLQAKFPDIRSYAGIGIEDPSASLRFSVSPKGVQTMILRADRATEFIEPYTSDANVYVAFKSSDKRDTGKLPFTCHSKGDSKIDEVADEWLHRSAMSSDPFLRTFRLALSCTGEYAAYHGGTVGDAFDAMNATMTRVNGVFQKDLAVKLVMIDNTSIIFTNASTDPYSPAAQGAGDDALWSPQLQSTLNSNVGSANYDIGHLFGASGGGGYAGCIGCVCINSTKGSGFTSPINNVPESDTFDIDFVAHEMGHQLGAEHTYSVVNEQSGVNIEPGSGSTIMGYAGITGPTTDVQNHSDDYFAYRSIVQIQTNVQNKACAVKTPINNAAMTINAGADYTIPKGTPFILKAVGAAVNGSNVTYTWEQNDNVTTATSGNNSAVYANKPAGPTFRSVVPSQSPNRYMPKLSSVLNNTLTANWETVSNVARTLNFSLTGRDNVAAGGQTKSDLMKVNVNAAGPFTVTSQNTDGIIWQLNTTQTITWNVAGTTAAPINTANVNILLSTDGGLTFTTVLAANTPNDGSQVINVPNVTSGSCRIMVESVGNIYYAVNQKVFAINATVTTTCNTYTNNTPLIIPDGTGESVPGATVASALNVANTSAILDVNVTAHIEHPYVQDIVVGLRHPDGTVAYLWTRNCLNQSNNFTITFNDGSPAINCNALTGTYRPTQPLTVFNGKSANGVWGLLAADFYNGDVGKITSWSLEICTATVTPLSNEEFGLANFALYPNPNTGSFTVEFNSSTTNDINIAIHDMRGRQVFDKAYQNTGLFSGNVQLGNIQAGVYLVTVHDGNNKVVKRIVVE